MKPITSKTDLTPILANKPLLLLNKRLFSINYIKQLRALKTTNLTTVKNALPTEVWDLIFKHILEEEEDSYCWVQAVSLSGGVLHCQEVDFQFPKKCGDFKRKAEV